MLRTRSRDSAAHEYEHHRRAVMGMLAKRFPRFDENERLEIYHEAWARVFTKRERGEEILSLRAYLLQTAAAEAMNAVTRGRPPLPVGPDDPVVTGIPDEGVPVEDRVLIRDQVRLARELIDSLDERQRDLLKLRWDLQLSASEIRSALGLSQRQYQRLAEEGAAAIASRVQELEDGTWSRRQRSLLTACLVQVGDVDSARPGIASDAQRAEAQRLLDSDPHVAALYLEVRGALRRAAAILPLPALPLGDGLLSSLLGDRIAAAADHATALAGNAKQQLAGAYLRAADATVLAGASPSAVAATVAAGVAISGGAYVAAEGVPTQLGGSPPQPVVQQMSSGSVSQPSGSRAQRQVRRRRKNPSSRPPDARVKKEKDPAVASRGSTQPPAAPSADTPSAPTEKPVASAAPAAPAEAPTEFDFEN